MLQLKINNQKFRSSNNVKNFSNFILLGTIKNFCFQVEFDSTEIFVSLL